MPHSSPEDTMSLPEPAARGVQLDERLLRLVAQLPAEPLWRMTVARLHRAAAGIVSVALVGPAPGSPQPAALAGDELPASLIQNLTRFDAIATAAPQPLVRWVGRLRGPQGLQRYAAASVLPGYCTLVLGLRQDDERARERIPGLAIRAAGALARWLEHRRALETVERLRRALDQAPSAVLLLDAERRIEYLNPLFTEMTGFTVADLVGKPVEVLNSQQLGKASFSPLLWHKVDSNRLWQVETLQRRKDGEHYWAETRISCVHDELGNIEQYVIQQNDFTEARLLSARLSYNSAHDLVTGLINRHQFESELAEVVASARIPGSSHALLYLDTDKFKVINDTCGHAAGDQLLHQLARLLREAAGDAATLSRLGGDEFALLVDNPDPAAVMTLATRIIDAVRAFRFRWRGNLFPVGISIGICLLDESVQDGREVLRRADVSCQLAKDRGGNQYHVFSVDDLDLLARHGQMEWTARISECLADGRFELYAQPIVRVHSETDNGLLHAEILVRMIDVEGRRISPSVFMDAAERYNLASEIDRWVVTHTLQWLAQNPAVGSRVERLSVNLSGHSLTNPGFLAYVLELLAQPGLPADKLCFEITETAAAQNLADAIDFINLLKDRGCVFALDDFGVGVSSFAYLKSLPVDYLKIDGRFIRRIDQDAVDYGMLKSINEIGHLMGKKTVAEYVETESVLQKLREIGVDYCQGHLVGEPVLLEDLGQVAGAA